MTTTYDPHHPEYLDEADVRNELTRVFGVCHGCRQCVQLCTSFPTLFDYVDRFDDRDAGRLTPAEQDQVIDACYHCQLCAINCPYVPELHDWELDFPRLMLRAEAMRHAGGQHPLKQQIANQAMARTDLLGRIGSIAAPIANRTVRAPQGSFVRKAMATTAGVSSTRLLPPYAKQRFSTWFRKRSGNPASKRQGAAIVFPTCLVEYQDVQVGKDLVNVYERNGVECSTTGAGCCGAPWLHAGDIEQFAKVADKNVRTLAAEIRAGAGDVVVPEPTCGYVLKRDYADYCNPARRADAELVAAHTFDAAEFLVRLHQADDTELDTEFAGDVPDRITYHVACHLRAQHVGFTSRDLMTLTGAEVELVQQCSGIDGMWGFRDGNEEIAVPVAKQLADRIRAANATAEGSVVVAGDCSLANTAIAEQTGEAPSHPLSIVARAYGIDPD